MKHIENQPPSARALPLMLVAVGMLLVAVVVIWQVAQQGQVTIAAPQPTATNDPNIPYPNIPRVALADARQALEKREAVFLDVRSADSFAAAHVPGARNIPLGELENRAGELDPNDWIITYCT
jgi:3-mercaptopyruvate sulfurtransferase SseA